MIEKGFSCNSNSYFYFCISCLLFLIFDLIVKNSSFFVSNSLYYKIYLIFVEWLESVLFSIGYSLLGLYPTFGYLLVFASTYIFNFSLDSLLNLSISAYGLSSKCLNGFSYRSTSFYLEIN